jgi:hypothetical protein
MGLLAEFTMDDLGYADSTEELGIYIDYSYGCEVFAATFLEVAQDLVPVDTGRLMASIESSANSDGCTCITRCEYAEYVEYGTCYMGAQPYFEPALMAALDAAIPYWDEAVEEAMEEEEELLEEMEEAERASRGMRGGGLGMRGGGRSFAGMVGGFLGLIIGAIIVGLIQGFFNMLSEGRSYSSGHHSSFSSRESDHLKGYIDQIDVEII